MQSEQLTIRTSARPTPTNLPPPASCTPIGILLRLSPLGAMARRRRSAPTKLVLHRRLARSCDFANHGSSAVFSSARLGASPPSSLGTSSILRRRPRPPPPPPDHLGHSPPELPSGPSPTPMTIFAIRDVRPWKHRPFPLWELQQPARHPSWGFSFSSTSCAQAGLRRWASGPCLGGAWLGVMCHRRRHCLAIASLQRKLQ